MTEPTNRRLRDQFSGTPTFVAENMRIVGNLHGNGPVVVCGRIEGDGDIAGAVQLAAGARWHGNLHAQHAIVAGEIDGRRHRRAGAGDGDRARHALRREARGRKVVAQLQRARPSIHCASKATPCASTRLLPSGGI
jgi:hypothetical protein